MDEVRRNRNTPIRALIIDDSPLMRNVLGEILTRDGDIEVAGMASNGLEGLEKISSFKPDVVTLDMDMPVMNGMVTLKHIMVRHQLPVVIISSLIHDGFFAFEALRLGVMDFLPKLSPVAGAQRSAEEEIFRKRVRLAAKMKVHRIRRVRRSKETAQKRAASSTSPTQPAQTFETAGEAATGGDATPFIVTMGTTLAGPNAVMRIVLNLPSGFSGTVVALQEIHPRVLTSFCSYFNRISPIEVVRACDGRPLLPGRVYMGSTLEGARLERHPDGKQVVLRTGGHSQAPIDTLMRSAVECFGTRTCAVILTGTGEDGVRGMELVRERGGQTIVQEQETCVYPDLVRHAIERKCVDLILPVHEIAGRLSVF